MSEHGFDELQRRLTRLEELVSLPNGTNDGSLRILPGSLVVRGQFVQEPVTGLETGADQVLKAADGSDDLGLGSHRQSGLHHRVADFVSRHAGHLAAVLRGKGRTGFKALHEFVRDREFRH